MQVPNVTLSEPGPRLRIQSGSSILEFEDLADSRGLSKGVIT